MFHEEKQRAPLAAIAETQVTAPSTAASAGKAVQRTPGHSPHAPLAGRTTEGPWKRPAGSQDTEHTPPSDHKETAEEPSREPCAQKQRPGTARVSGDRSSDAHHTPQDAELPGESAQAQGLPELEGALGTGAKMWAMPSNG